MKKSMIICVDDEKVVLISLKTQLRRALGQEIIIETADSAEEALIIFEDAIKNNYELPIVISDHIMPGMKGDEFLAIIYKKSKKSLSILLTGQADAEAVGRAVNNAKLYRYISKPWDEADLVLTIKEALKSYKQDSTIEEQKIELEKYVIKLKDYNETLEQKVLDRTIELENKKNEIQIQHDLLVKQKRDITDSLNYASLIQQALLQSDNVLKLNFKDHFILFKPRDIVSGDFYWFRQIDNLIYIVAADCTGHGVPGAFMSILGISLLNEIITKCHQMKANEILNELRQRVINSLNQKGQKAQTHDGMDIAFCIFDSEKKIIQFAGANNPFYLIRQIEDRFELFETKADKMPIGIHPKDHISFSNFEIQLQENDSIYIFSDGYVSQFGGEKCEKIKMKPFQELLSKIHNLPMNQQKHKLDYFLSDWQGLNEQIDDILVVGIKC